jgi:hypothetical protein
LALGLAPIALGDGPAVARKASPDNRQPSIANRQPQLCVSPTLAAGALKPPAPLPTPAPDLRSNKPPLVPPDYAPIPEVASEGPGAAPAAGAAPGAGETSALSARTMGRGEAARVVATRFTPAEVLALTVLGLLALAVSVMGIRLLAYDRQEE